MQTFHNALNWEKEGPQKPEQPYNTFQNKARGREAGGGGGWEETSKAEFDLMIVKEDQVLRSKNGPLGIKATNFQPQHFEVIVLVNCYHRNSEAEVPWIKNEITVKSSGCNRAKFGPNLGGTEPNRNFHRDKSEPTPTSNLHFRNRV